MTSRLVKKGVQMQIKQIMKKAVFVSPGATKKELLSIAKKHPQTKIFVVVDKEGNFMGDLHEDDLFYMLLPNESYEDIGVELAFDIEKKFFAMKAKDIMRRHDIKCCEDDDIMDVALQFATVEFNEMPVINKKGKITGFIDQATILRHLKLK